MKDRKHKYVASTFERMLQLKSMINQTELTFSLKVLLVNL